MGILPFLVWTTPFWPAAVINAQFRVRIVKKLQDFLVIRTGNADHFCWLGHGKLNSAGNRSAVTTCIVWLVRQWPTTMVGRISMHYRFFQLVRFSSHNSFVHCSFKWMRFVNLRFSSLALFCSSLTDFHTRCLVRKLVKGKSASLYSSVGISYDSWIPRAPSGVLDLCVVIAGYLNSFSI